jgi:transposase
MTTPEPEVAYPNLRTQCHNCHGHGSYGVPRLAMSAGRLVEGYERKECPDCEGHGWLVGFQIPM